MRYFRIKIILIFILSANYAYSQFSAAGIRISGNYCGLWGQGKPQNFTPNWGFGAGIFINPNHFETISPVFEINYARRVFDFTEPIILLDNSELNVLEKSHYLEIPIMLKLNKGDEIMSTHINIGWQASLLLHNEKILSAQTNGHILTATEYYDFKNNFYEYGFIAGAGFQYRNIILDARYYFAMRNVHSGDLSREMRYNTLFISAAYHLNYNPPRVFRKYSFFKELKYKIKKRF